MASTGANIVPPREKDGPPMDTDDKTKSSTVPRIRRRNRMITSCLECRRRKLKCDKLQPCTNCNKFSRKCTFLAPALDSVSQQKLNEIKDKMGSLERVLEEDVAKKSLRKSTSSKERRSSTDLPGDEGSSSDGDAPIPEDEKDLLPTPLAVQDASFEDDTNDEVLDLGVRIGKFRMTERLGGYFRPRMTEELVYTIAEASSTTTSKSEKLQELPPLPDDGEDFLEPGPTFIAPGAGFVFGNASERRSLIDFLPTKLVADTLVKNYYENVHFVARVVHWPSWQVQYDDFWTNVLAGVEPRPSQQALVLAVFFSAVVSMPEADITTLFARPKRIMEGNFQAGTEMALSKANFLRATKIETLQALVMYLIPMCRDQMSRAHSVLVAAAVRLGECMSLYRDPGDTYALSPVDCHIRRTLWFQLCFLDFKTGDVQGPRPGIKRDDYDTRFPLNINDVDLLSARPQEKTLEWTDMTLSRIRFECNEMHRIIWQDRIRLEKKKVSITHVLAKIESFRKAMETKYAPILNIEVPIQKYARLVMDVQLLRMHIMILHRYQTNIMNTTPERLSHILINTGTKAMESAVRIETQPELERWRWYSGSLQNWHIAFLLLTIIFQSPERPEADRIWNVLDFVFQPNPTLSRKQKAITILAAIRDRTAIYRDLRKIRAPVEMTDNLGTKLANYRAATAPTMLQPQKLSSDSELAVAGSRPKIIQEPEIRTSESPQYANGGNSDQSWSFDTSATYFIHTPRPRDKAGDNLGVPVAKESRQGPLQPSPGNTYEFSPPSDSGTGESRDSWPPLITDDQVSWGVIPAFTRPIPIQGTTQTSNQSTENQGAQLTSPYAVPFPNPNFPTNNQQTDTMMLDIDWTEWDRIFPLDGNPGNLIVPTDSSVFST